MHLVTKRSHIASGIAILLALLSTAMYFHLTPKQNRSAHAASAVQTAPGYPAFHCVARPNVQVPPPPPHAHFTSDGTTYTAPCPAGQVPQPLGQKIPKETLPPVPSGSHIPANTSFLYVSYAFSHTDTDMGSDMSQPNPFLKSTDDHSLTEIAASSSDAQQVVEVGNNVDNGLNGDLHTHLFVYYWINGVGQGYNGGAWTQVSSTRVPGMQITATTINPQEYQIEYSGGNWWVWYQTEWIGYYPGSSWTSPTFTQIQLEKWFGEVAAETTTPCTDMGNGNFGDATGVQPAEMNGFTGDGSTINGSFLETHSSYYDHGFYSGSGTTISFDYGGPGSGGVVKGC